VSSEAGQGKGTAGKRDSGQLECTQATADGPALHKRSPSIHPEATAGAGDARGRLGGGGGSAEKVPVSGP
jgi:hypothetical protein